MFCIGLAITQSQGHTMTNPITKRLLLLALFVLLCISAGTFYAYIQNNATNKKYADDAKRIEQSLKDLEARAATLPGFPSFPRVPPNPPSLLAPVNPMVEYLPTAPLLTT